MTAYVIMRISVNDSEKLKDYQQVAPSIIQKYNGKLLARGGEVISLEGPEEHRRLVVIQFPSLKLAKDFYHSDEYTQAIALRESAAKFEIIAIEGLEG